MAGHRRLLKSRDFAGVYNEGRRWVGRTFVAFFRSREGYGLRLGVVASKRVGGAVQRNRARRILREIFRAKRWAIGVEGDLVMVARATLLEARYEAVLSTFARYVAEELQGPGEVDGSASAGKDPLVGH